MSESGGYKVTDSSDPPQKVEYIELPWEILDFDDNYLPSPGNQNFTKDETITPVTLGATLGGSGYVYALTGLPAGLSFNAGTRMLSGTPTAEGTTTATYTAVNDDHTHTLTFDIVVAATPQLAINSPRIQEGDTGAKNLEFTVTLTPPSDQQVTVQYADANSGTATSGTDYTAVTGGTLTFTAGDTEQTFTVEVLGDRIDEGESETVEISLSGATGGAEISGGTGTGVIDDNDRAVLSINKPEPGVDEGDSGTVDLIFTVTLNPVASRPVTVNYAHDATRSTATPGTDFEAVSGTLRFEPGDSTMTIAVKVIGDTDVEDDETVRIELSNAQNADLLANEEVSNGTIRNDDTNPTVSINSPTVTEGDSGTANLEFTVTLNPTLEQQVTVAWADAGTGTATSGTDYTAVSGGTLTFAPGDSTKTVTVTVTGDEVDEVDETVQLELSNATGGATIGTATGTGTIADDDEATLAIDSPGVDEGDSGTVDLEFTVTLDPVSDRQVTVAWADAGTGTATSGTDYTAVSGGTLTFAPGDSTKTVTVAVTGDEVDEIDETVEIALSGATGGAEISTGTGTGTGTIRDDEGASLRIDSPQVSELNAGATSQLTFSVTLDPVSASQVTVAWADAGTGTATSGTDYTAVSGGTLTFAPGDTVKFVRVTVTGDGAVEDDETVVIALSGASGATIGTATGTGTITDNDVARFSIGDVSVDEGDSGTANLTFSVTLDPASNTEVSVRYSDADTGTATSGTDYQAVSPGTLTFPSGVVGRTFTVAVNGDALDENDETVEILLTQATGGATISDATGTGTIRDDDEAMLSISSPNVGEGDSGTASVNLTVTLDPVSTRQVTVAYADSGAGTATSGTDYQAVSPGTLTFPPGTGTRTITVTVNGDEVDEVNETVEIELSNATGGATISDDTGTVAITDDDDAELSIDSPRVTEVDAGATSTLTFTLTLDPVSDRRVTVAYADTGNGTADSGTDYEAVSGGTLTFEPGDSTKTFTVTVTGDDILDGSETVEIALSGATGGASIGTATGTGTIVDNESPLFSISSSSVAEGDSGTANLTFTVTLDPPLDRRATVAFADSGGGTATSGTDYAAVSGGTLTFAPGDRTKTVTVAVRGDEIDEDDETVEISLSGATGGTVISTAAATGTITDDDTAALSIDSPRVAEGDSGTANLTFTVTLDPVSSRRVTVAYADSDGGTATSGTDYAAVSPGTLTFAPGESAKTVTVAVRGDAVDEADETVGIALSGATGGADIATATATGRITDDDTAALSIDSPRADEVDTGATSTLTFTVTLAPVSDRRVTVAYADSGGGTATSGTDYEAVSGGTLTFAAGDSTKTFTVTVNGDEADEDDETVEVRLSGATGGATIETAVARGTIVDNDTPRFSIGSASVVEGDSGTAELAFTVTLDPLSERRVAVTYADTGNGTATSGTDYAPVTRDTLTFAPGDSAKTVTVAVNGDDIVELDETVVIELVSATGGAEIATATATGTITDDDVPVISIGSPSVAEGDSGTADLAFAVTLDQAPVVATTVNYALGGGGTAQSGVDHEALSDGTLRFAVGESEKTITVTVNGDEIDEEDETVTVTLSGATGGATIGTATGTGTITDDDTAALAIDSPRADEVDTGATSTLTFTVTLDPVSDRQVTVAYADSGSGTTTSGTDYEAVTGATLTFAAGESEKTFTVTVNGDDIGEGDETIEIVLSGATGGAEISTATGTGTIVDNDIPRFSIDSPSVAEGDSGTAALTFTVTLDPLAERQVTVAYADSGNGTATSGDDYAAVTGATLTFAGGESEKTFTVTVNGDETVELDETVEIGLSGATGGAEISTGTGTGTIANDDFPEISIDSPEVDEGDSGTVELTFTVTLHQAPVVETTVDYALGGTAQSGVDYEALSDGTLTFAVGESERTITVTVNGDGIDEEDETVTVTLSGATGGATISSDTWARARSSTTTRRGSGSTRRRLTRRARTRRRRCRSR